MAGEPVRVPLASPDIGPLERRYVNDAISSGWVSGTGPYVDRLESALCARLGRNHVVAVSSGTMALELALRALGIGRGHEVIVPALTFAAPAAAVRMVGADPVLADISPETWTIDPLMVGDLITLRTAAIIAVDVMGHCCDYDALAEFGLPVIEDAAEAHGAEYRGQRAGSLGLISVLSFHPNKAITTGEGGCVATDSAEIAETVRVLANHGMTPERPYFHERVGHNARMTNLSAALGVAQVERWDELLGNRHRVGQAYLRRLADIDCPARPQASWATVSLWLQAVTVEHRDEVVRLIRGDGIDARAIRPALSDLPLYRASRRRPCPVASRIAARTAWLPTSARMDEALVVEVTRSLARARSAAADSMRGGISGLPDGHPDRAAGSSGAART